MVEDLVIVDTSVLIGFLRGDKNSKVDYFRKMLQIDSNYAISALTYDEVLRGAKTQKDFEKLDELLFGMEIIYLPQKKEFFREIAHVYMSLRKKGITIASTPDIMIALSALQNNAKLLHNDSDFELISEVLDIETI